MRIINPGKTARITVYAWQEGSEFLLSPSREIEHGRRPIQRYDSRQELEQDVAARGNTVEWLTD